MTPLMWMVAILEAIHVIYVSVAGYLENTGAIVHRIMLLPSWMGTGILGWIIDLAVNVFVLAFAVWHGVLYNRLVELQRTHH
jgi:hypothetical protein